MRLTPSVLAVFLLGAVTSRAEEARRPDLAPVRESKVEKMSPFNVREAVFPSIDVHFELSGLNLADSLNDPIVQAEITTVDDDGMGDRLGLKVGDLLVSLNNTPLRGLTIRQLAALVADARERKAPLIWETRRGFAKNVVRYNGKWDTPLPGLKK